MCQQPLKKDKRGTPGSHDYDPKGFVVGYILVIVFHSVALSLLGDVLLNNFKYSRHRQ